MNHCIPNRRLKPYAAAVNTGFVVTSALAGEFVHYVFCDKHTPLFKMPIKLFKCNDYVGLKSTEIIRCEKTLEFGDGIYFTADNRGVIIDYEKSMKVYETNCVYDKNLVRTICVLPPIGTGMKCWSELFGIIELSLEKWNELNLQASNDVPIFSWVAIKIDFKNLKVLPIFDEFIEVAVDERKVAWETDWNLQRASHSTSIYKWDTTDDEDEGQNDIIEKNDGQILDVKLKMEGYLICHREIFCPELRHHRVRVGLWEKDLSKLANLPLGNRFRFDAYFSDILQAYITYYYEDVTTEEVCWVGMDEELPEKKMIQIRLYLSDTFGRLYNNSEFGLVFDPKRTLGPLTYLFADLEVDEVWVNVIDIGPNAKNFCRFVISEEQPPRTVELIEASKELAKNRERNIYDEGFIIDSKGTFFSPRNATQCFIFPESQIRNFPVGYWTSFEAEYDPATNKHMIIGGELISEKGAVPNSRIDYYTAKYPGNKLKKYQFKIEAELISTPSNIFTTGHLYNPMYGLVADPDAKFVKRKRVKRYKLIVEFDFNDELQTLVKLVRMAQPDELLDSEKLAKNGITSVPFNEKLDEDEMGLAEPEEMEEANEEPISQVDYLSKFAIRERKMLARERKRARDKLEKQLLEQQKMLLTEAQPYLKTD